MVTLLDVGDFSVLKLEFELIIVCKFLCVFRENFFEPCEHALSHRRNSYYPLPVIPGFED